MKINFFKDPHDLYQFIYKNKLNHKDKFHYFFSHGPTADGVENSYYVIYNEKEILGVLAIQINPKNKEELWIKYIDINKKYKKQGLATILMRKAFEFAKKNNLYIRGSRRSEEGKMAFPAIIDKMKNEFPNVKYVPSPFNEKMYFSFGRFCPPTIGHQKVFNRLYETALKDKAKHCVFVSQSFDPIRNPIKPTDKLQFLEAIFPHINFAPLDLNVINPYSAARYLSEQGFKDVKMFVGDDRAKEFDAGIRAYINHPDPEKSYAFENFEIISVGSRLDEDDISQASGTKAREAAFNNNFELFKTYIPSNNIDILESIYYSIREGHIMTTEI